MVAAAIVGSAVVGGVMGDQASRRAARTQTDAANQATELQREQYYQSRADAAPWTAGGVDAYNQMRQQYGMAPVAMPAGLNVGAPQMNEANFDADAYLRANPDVAQGWRGGSAYDHYQMYGANEGRGYAWTPEAQQQQAAYSQWASQQPGAAAGGGQIVGEGARGGMLGGSNTSGMLQNGGGAGAAPAAPAGQQTGLPGFSAPQDRVTQAQGGLAGVGNDLSLATGNRLAQVMSDPAAARAMMEADPGYAFRLQEGENALSRSAAARGGLLSGRAAKDMAAYSQGQASQEFANAWSRAGALDDRDWSRQSQLDDRTYGRALTDANRAWDQNAMLDNRDYSRAWDQNQTNWNRLASMAGLGQTSQQNTSALGANFANAAASNAIGAGNAASAGQMGAANAWSNAIGQGVNQYQTNQLFSQYLQQQRQPTNYSALVANANATMNTGDYYG